MDGITHMFSKQSATHSTSGVLLPHPNNFMKRDQGQSSRLHEPTSISSHTDPITGDDVVGSIGHPYVVDGILTVYFESEKTKKQYLDTQVNHPVKVLGGEVALDADRGG